MAETLPPPGRVSEWIAQDQLLAARDDTAGIYQALRARGASRTHMLLVAYMLLYAVDVDAPDQSVDGMVRFVEQASQAIGMLAVEAWPPLTRQ